MTKKDKKKIKLGRYICCLLGILILITVASSATKCLAQEKVDKTLYVFDLAIRSLDAASTYKLLSSPCKCFAEADPFVPGARSLFPLLSYQYAYSVGTIGLSRLLVRRHHSRLARMLLIVDIASESYVVQHNMRLQEFRNKGVGLQQ